MTSDGATREVVVQVAVWLLELSVAALQPGITVPSFVKLTVPVGVVVNGCEAVSVAVKVTLASTAEGEPDEVTANVVDACETVCVTLFEVAVT